jgi:hypothetical protein
VTTEAELNADDVAELGDLDPLAVLDSLPQPEGEPVAFLSGTFALYKDRQGGVVGVFQVDPGSPVGAPAGEQRLRLPAGLLRALSAILSGSGPLGRLMGRKALRGR